MREQIKLEQLLKQGKLHAQYEAAREILVHGMHSRIIEMCLPTSSRSGGRGKAWKPLKYGEIK